MLCDLQNDRPEMQFNLSQISISGRSAVSALGYGKAAHLHALKTLQTGLGPCDFDDVNVPCYVGRVDGLEALDFPIAHASFDNRANRLALAAVETDGFAAQVADAVARWGADRVGLVVGTSTSGVERLEAVYRARENDGALDPSYSIRHHSDHNGVAEFLGDLLCLDGPAFTISTACSSSQKAIVDAVQMIQIGICDAVVSAGIDSLCMTSLYGFEALELVSRMPCRPADANRDGLSIGEGAGLLLVERGADGPFMSGYGESLDAVNMSTPPSDGSGAAVAMRAALTRADISAEDLSFVKLHGTATQLNDLAETAAVVVAAPEVVATSLKGLIGHTLGAAGALEAVMCLDALEAGIIPGTAGLVQQDQRIGCHIPKETTASPAKHVLCNALGFGGNNCSIILSAR